MLLLGLPVGPLWLHAFGRSMDALLEHHPQRHVSQDLGRGAAPSTAATTNAAITEGNDPLAAHQRDMPSRNSKRSRVGSSRGSGGAASAASPLPASDGGPSLAQDASEVRCNIPPFAHTCVYTCACACVSACAQSTYSFAHTCVCTCACACVSVCLTGACLNTP